MAKTYLGGSTIIRTWNPYGGLAEKRRDPYKGAIRGFGKEESAEIVRQYSESEPVLVDMATVLRPVVATVVRRISDTLTYVVVQRIRFDGCMPKDIDGKILSRVANKMKWRKLDETKRKIIRALALEFMAQFPRAERPIRTSSKVVGKIQRPHRKR